MTARTQICCASAFHPGAQIHYGKLYEGEVEGWISSAIAHQAGQSQTQHMVGNINVRVSGDAAVVESYELARHKTPISGEVRDLALAMRTLDRFVRRDGEWRIIERPKGMDWGRALRATRASARIARWRRGVRTSPMRPMTCFADLAATDVGPDSGFGGTR